MEARRKTGSAPTIQYWGSKSWLGLPRLWRFETCTLKTYLFIYFFVNEYCTTALIYYIPYKTYVKNRDFVRMNLEFVFFSWIVLCTLCFGSHWITNGGVGVGDRFLGSLQHINLIILPLCSFTKWVILGGQRNTGHPCPAYTQGPNTTSPETSWGSHFTHRQVGSFSFSFSWAVPIPMAPSAQTLTFNWSYTLKVWAYVALKHHSRRK